MPTDDCLERVEEPQALHTDKEDLVDILARAAHR